jgi:hypothetical protein
MICLLWRRSVARNWPENKPPSRKVEQRPGASGKYLSIGDIRAAMAELRSAEGALVERRLAAVRETAASGVEAGGLYRPFGIRGPRSVQSRRLR